MLVSNPDPQNVIIEEEERKARSSVGKRIAIVLLIILSTVALGWGILSYAHLLDSTREDNMRQNELVAERYAMLGEKYDVDLSNVSWGLVTTMPDDANLFRGWGYDAENVPTLFYLIRPAQDGDELDIDKITLYKTSGDQLVRVGETQ